MKRFIAVLFLVFLPSLAFAEDYAARVVGVTDGDTLTVLKSDRTQVKIRLASVDAPEMGQDYGTKAKAAASELAFGKDVTIRPSGQDRYGRTIAEVILPDGKSLGVEMVRAGMAWRYVKYAPNEHEWNSSKRRRKPRGAASGARRTLWRRGIGDIRRQPTRRKSSAIAAATSSMRRIAPAWRK